MQVLAQWFGVDGNALSQMAEFLVLQFGVPQGFVLGSRIFTEYEECLRHLPASQKYAIICLLMTRKATVIKVQLLYCTNIA